MTLHRLAATWRSRRRRLPQRAHDCVALGAHRYASRPGPAGIDELGHRFIETHGGNDAAFGWILWRLHRLEKDS